MALNDTIDQIDLIDIFRPFQPKAAEYTFFSSAHGMFPGIDPMLGQVSINLRRSTSYKASSQTTML